MKTCFCLTFAVLLATRAAELPWSQAIPQCDGHVILAGHTPERYCALVAMTSEDERESSEDRVQPREPVTSPERVDAHTSGENRFSDASPLVFPRTWWGLSRIPCNRQLPPEE